MAVGDLPPQNGTETPAPRSPNAEFAETLSKIEQARADERRAREEEKQLILEKLAQLEQQQAAILKKSQPDDSHPLASIPDAEIEAIAYDAENPGRMKTGQDELWRRREQKMRQQIAEEQNAIMRKKEELANAVLEMQQKFGPEITQKGTDLNARAEMEMQAIMRARGQEARFDPQMQMLAAERASNFHLQQKVKEAEQAKKELADYKRAQAMERGNQTVARPNDTVKQILKTRKDPKKVDDAIKAMNLRQWIAGGEG